MASALNRFVLLRAVVFTLIQVGTFLLAAGPASLAMRYRSSVQWDAGWYLTVVEGYHRPEELGADDHKSNLGFLPGYPLVAEALRHFLPGWTRFMVHIIAAQLFCFLFWLLLFAALSVAGCSLLRQMTAAFAILSFPGAFFLVTAYPESLFLFLALASILALASDRKRDNWLGAFLGSWLVITRLVGICIACLPAFYRCLFPLTRGRDEKLKHTVTQTLVICLSVGVFSIFCWYRFGDALAYIHAQKGGWNTNTDPAVLFRSSLYSLNLKDSELTFSRKMIFPLATFILMSIGFTFAKPNPTPWLHRARAGLSSSAVGFFVVPLIAFEGTSLMRHGLAGFVFCVVSLAYAPVRLGRWKWAVLLLVVGAGALMWLAQWGFIVRYSHGGWVA